MVEKIETGYGEMIEQRVRRESVERKKREREKERERERNI